LFERSFSVSKIFVRQRRHVGQGAGRPRYAIVAAHGTELSVYKTRLRRAELEKIAAEIGAEIVFLPRGESEGEGGRGRRSRDGRDES
jgi:hypothetical protein